MKPLRILITGSTGYIGQHLTSHLLLKKEAEIFGFNRTYDSKLQASHSQEGNLLDADLLGWIGEIQPHIIFHAIGASPKSPFDHQLRIHVEGTRRLLQAVIDNGLRPKVILLGSAAEYGLRNEAVDEEAICRPEGEYGIAKLAQTQIAQSFSRRYDLPVIIGRVFNVYGHTEKHLAIASLASQIAQAEAVFPMTSELHVYNLRSARDFIHIDDLVEALWLIANQTGHNESSGQIYNLGSGKSTSMSTILDQLLLHSKIQSADRQSLEMKLHGTQQEDNSRADIRKIQQLTGWKPQISLEQGLKREMNYWRSNLALAVSRG